MIVTKYHGATNHKGSRVSARGAQGRIMLPWDDALSSEENHRGAAKAYAKRYGLTPRQWGEDENLDRTGYTFATVRPWDKVKF